ncbi:MAG: hypothetical protein HZC51_00395 [Nitrospirae bacterium]|nr:hypothetical protein [Nitrospirota bacterium]
MGVKVELSLEQIADALRHLKRDEVETLELLVSADTEKELLKRRKEARAGNTLLIDKMSAFKGL